MNAHGGLPDHAKRVGLATKWSLRFLLVSQNRINRMEERRIKDRRPPTRLVRHLQLLTNLAVAREDDWRYKARKVLDEVTD